MPWKDMVKVAAPAILTLIAAGPVGAHEDDGIATECLETVAERGRWFIRNRCDVRVHIAWCEEEDNGYCGWKGGPNLEPGGTHSTGRVSVDSARFKVAGCRSDFGHGGMWGTPDPDTDAFVCLTPKSGALRLDANIEDDHQGSTHCLEGVGRNDRLYVRNTCNYALAMAYCDKTGVSAEYACGRDGERFYTLTKELQPGEEWSSPWHSIEAEACRINRPGFSPFNADRWDGKGGFGCLDGAAAGTGTGSSAADHNHCLVESTNVCDYRILVWLCLSQSNHVNSCGARDPTKYYTLPYELSPNDAIPGNASYQFAACRISDYGLAFEPDGWDGKGGFSCASERGDAMDCVDVDHRGAGGVFFHNRCDFWVAIAECSPGTCGGDPAGRYYTGEIRVLPHEWWQVATDEELEYAVCPLPDDVDYKEWVAFDDTGWDGKGGYVCRFARPR